MSAKSMQPDVVDVRDAIDIHFHPHPDLIPRAADDRGIAERANECGMRALVLKCHFEPTVGRAYDVNQQFETIDVYGGITLNRYTGGINPIAVETSVRLGAKIIWMPTVDSPADTTRRRAARSRSIPCPSSPRPAN